MHPISTLPLRRSALTSQRDLQQSLRWAYCLRRIWDQLFRHRTPMAESPVRTIPTPIRRTARISVIPHRQHTPTFRHVAQRGGGGRTRVGDQISCSMIVHLVTVSSGAIPAVSSRNRAIDGPLRCTSNAARRRDRPRTSAPSYHLRAAQNFELQGYRPLAPHPFRAHSRHSEVCSTIPKAVIRGNLAALEPNNRNGRVLLSLIRSNVVQSSEDRQRKNVADGLDGSG